MFILAFPTSVVSCNSEIFLISILFPKEQINSIPNGIICLKGGNLSAEIEPFKKIADQVTLTNYFKEPFFETKKLIYIPIN